MISRKLLIAAAAALLAGCGAEPVEGGGCAVNADCAGADGPSICRKETGSCVPLLNEQCVAAVGDPTAQDALVLGAILPVTGVDAESGEAMRNAIALAIDDFEKVGGLPPLAEGQPARHLAAVVCTEEGGADTAVLSAKHLVEDIGVPAIVGPAFSKSTIEVATQVTVPGGVLLLSPSATSVNITHLADDGLLWRTAPSDILQAGALALYVPELEAEVRAELGLLPGDKVRVAVLHKGDVYGKDLGAELESHLLLNGAPALDGANADSYLRRSYGDPTQPEQDPPKYQETVDAVVAFEPHITLLIGTQEAVTEVLAKIEPAWPAAAAHRSRFVLTDGGRVPDLSSIVADPDVDVDGTLRSRVRGTSPGKAPNDAVFEKFRITFTARWDEAAQPYIFGVAGSYDSAYLIAYSAAALGGEAPTGKGLAGGIARLVPSATASPVDAGSSQIAQALSVLRQEGGQIDFNGASGPLDFDLVTGEAPADIQIWCLPPGAGPGDVGQAADSGLYFDSKTQALSGAEGASCK